MVLNNLGGNKLDYYLDRQIEYVASGCYGSTRRSTVTVRLKNTVTNPESLPDNVAEDWGFSRKQEVVSFLREPCFTSVRLLATQGTKLVSLMSNGTQIDVHQDTERNHPSFEAQVVIPAGQTAELIFDLSEPTAPGPARAPEQPLVGPVTTKVSVPQCP